MKSRKESFLSGIIALMFSQIFIKILGMIHSVYLTNKEGFGDTGNAIYMSGFQIYILILTICSVGVPNTISKLVAERIGNNDEYNAKRILNISFYIFGIIGFLGSFIMYFSASYISNNILRIPEAEYTLIALAPSIFFVSINSVFRGYFNGKKMMNVVAKIQVSEQLIKTIATIVLVEAIAVIGKNDTKLMASIANIGTTISTIITFVYVTKLYIENRQKIQIKDIKKKRIIHIIRDIIFLLIPLSLTSLISALNKNVDSITVVRILEPVYGENIAKIKYGILSTKIDLLLTMPLAFNISIATALIPEISSSKIKGNFENVKSKIKMSLLISLIIALPCFVGMYLYSNQIIYLLFPNANLGGELLKLASISIVFSSLIQTISAALQALDYVKFPIAVLCIGVVCKLIFNVILIPIEGVFEKGAVISTVISNLIVCIIAFFKLNSVCKIKNLLSEIFFRPIIVSGIMGGVSYTLYLLLNNMHIFSERIIILFVITISAIFYFYLIFKLKIIKIEEINEYYYKKR